MSHGPQRLLDYLGHILEAVERIEHYVSGLDGLARGQDAVI